MNNACEDNRFKLIKSAKQQLMDATNISTSPDEMKVLDNILFRFWQMGWLERILEKMKDNRKKPIVKKGKFPTLVGGLGYLNSVLCPKCRKLLFAHYDKDLEPNNGWRMGDFNYCSKCGQHLDLDVYKKLDEVQGYDEDITFDDREASK